MTLDGVVAADPEFYRYSIRHTDFHLDPAPIYAIDAEDIVRTL